MTRSPDQREGRFVHNVTPPPVRRYHCPSVGGQFTARIIDVAATGNGTWWCWHGYDDASGLDHVHIQHAQNDQTSPPVRLTDQPGCYGRPAVAVDGDGNVHVVWVEDGRRLVHRYGRGDDWGPPAVLTADGDSLRDVTLAADSNGAISCAMVCSRQQRDALVLWRFDGSGWQLAKDQSVDGFVSRPSLISDGDGRLWLACDRYQDDAYRVEVWRWADNELRLDHTFVEQNRCQTLGRLTCDAAGGVWLSYLSERIVERDGVIARALAVRVARRRDESWSDVPDEQGPDVALLYNGLLPIERYFGYSGLRRNPRLVATDDGRVHLVWEAQRSEQADWNNLHNCYLFGRTFDGQSWGELRLWHDGRCCIAVDHRTVHAAEAVVCLGKGEHRDDGADFEPFVVEPAATADAPVPDLTLWSTWQPAAPRAGTTRHRIEHDGQTLALYFGDFHNHSVHSPDAEGWPDELLHFARDFAAVDFAGVTDNDFYPEKALLAGESCDQRRLVARLDEPGRFLPFCGYEWTFHRDDSEQSYNHRSIVFLDDEQRIVRRIETGGATEAAFAKLLAGMNVFAHAHHAQYDLLGTDAEANVEITSGWAVNIEQSANTHEQLDAGRRFGFIAGSDSHRAVPGLGGALLAVWATDLTRPAIAEALRARRCYATMGNRTMIDFRLNGAMMGSVHCDPPQRRFDVHVVAQRPLQSVRIIRNGSVVHDFDVDGRQLHTTWTDDDDPPASCWYYLRVEDDMPWRDHPHNVAQAIGPLAWSSPIWVDASSAG